MSDPYREPSPSHPSKDPWANLKDGYWASLYAHVGLWCFVIVATPPAIVWRVYAAIYKKIHGDYPS